MKSVLFSKKISIQKIIKFSTTICKRYSVVQKTNLTSINMSVFISHSFTFYLFFIILFLHNSVANDTCFKKDHPNCESDVSNRYSKETNTKFIKYLQAVEEAKEAYVPCNATGCDCYKSTLIDDLKPFKDGISAKQIEDVKIKGTKYQVINNKLYRDKSCMFQARCAGIEHFILAVIDKLPDMELIINTRDWPQVYRESGVFGPVFSFSKTTKDYLDIMYPPWSFWEGGPAISLYPRGIGRWDILRKKLSKIAHDITWDEKIPKAFFRGSRTSSERDPLVLLSRENSDLVDAQYTKNQAWKSDADTLHAPPAEEVSFEEHCKYKYLFNFRGVAASFRFKHVLLCKSLVFHVGDEWLEFFYPALKPWIHYIPVKTNADKEEIQELIEFAIHHDDIGKEIAENGYNMIWNNLKLQHVTCYWLKLLKRYAKLLKFKPKLDSSLIEIK